MKLKQIKFLILIFKLNEICIMNSCMVHGLGGRDIELHSEFTFSNDTEFFKKNHEIGARCMVWLAEM